MTAFGPFAGRELVLAGGDIPDGALHVVFGANEAGKSTALRAVSGLLFGIPAQTTDGHHHSLTDLRVGAVLEAADGTVVDVVRRKGNKNTLLDTEGNPVDDLRLRRLCGAATEATFRALFGLDHVSLREGAEALLAGQGDVGESLFDASLGGGGGTHRLLQALEAEAEALFTPKGHKKKLNEAINAYLEARTAVRLKSRSGEGWLSQKRALDEAKVEHERLVEVLRGRKRELQRLERAKRLLPVTTRRAQVLARLQALGDVTLLSPDAARVREAAVQDRQKASVEMARLGRELAEISARRDGLLVPAWLDAPATARLADMQDRLGAHRKAARDRPGLVGVLAAHQAEAEALLARLPGVARAARDASGGIMVGVAERARVLGLSKQEALLVQHDGQARRGLEALEHRYAARVKELSELPPVEDGAPLRRLLRRVERDGDIEGRRETAREEREELAAELERLLAGLGLFGGAGGSTRGQPRPPEQVLALQVPSRESVDKFASELQAVDLREERLAEDRAELKHRDRVIDRKLAELTRAGEVPSLQALALARQERGEAWSHLRQSWDELDLEPGSTGPQASADSSAPRGWSERAGAMERAIARADEAADRLLREADRVARAAALYAEREDVARLVADAAAQKADLGRRRDAARLWWNAQWSALGVDAGGPEEMRDWLRRFGDAIDVARRLEKVTREAARLGEQVRRARDEIRGALGLGEPDGVERYGDLGTLCEQAAAVARVREEVASRRAALTREIEEMVADRARASRERDEAATALASWRGRWAEAVAPLGLPALASTLEAEAVLQVAEMVAQKQAEVASVERRLESIDRDASSFEADIRVLVVALAPDLGERPADEAVEVILQRHREGLSDREARRGIDVDLRRRRQAQQAAEAAHAEAEHRLSRLMVAAGASDLQTLEEAERRSAEALDLRRQLREHEDQILALSEGLNPDAAEREVAELAGEDLDDRIERLREEIEERDRDTQSASRLIGSTDAGLRLWDDPTAPGAADAAEEAQAHLARIRTLATEYARLRLAVRLLSREIERYREQHQGPVLARASELLARLTLNRYTGLRTDFDESDRPILRCVRADGARVSVDGLSDGTRDQLYLALRLATLEHQAASTEPLPLILDDILIHFDDQRAGAALDVLAEHAQGTQVVLFTHHARIVELATRIVPATRLRVSRLDA